MVVIKHYSENDESIASLFPIQPACPKLHEPPGVLRESTLLTHSRIPKCQMVHWLVPRNTENLHLYKYTKYIAMNGIRGHLRTSHWLIITMIREISSVTISYQAFQDIVTCDNVLPCMSRFVTISCLAHQDNVAVR